MRRYAAIVACRLLVLVSQAGALHAEEKWQGIDETVVQRIAKEHGREARKPLIDTGDGDLQLFAFLLAGAAGGFVAGYCWRALMEGKRGRGSDRPEE